MKISEIISFSFREELARIRQQEALRASRHLILYPTPHGNLVSRHLSTQSQFCRACVSMGYLSPQQMQHAALRYQLGMSRDGGVIFWQINQLGQVYDGKIMYYRPDCHRDHEHVPTWVISVIKSFYQCPVDIVNRRQFLHRPGHRAQHICLESSSRISAEPDDHEKESDGW